MYIPTQQDYDLLFQKQTKMCVKIEIYNDDNTILATLTSVKSESTYSVDGTSNTRRQFSGTLIPTYMQGLSITEDGIIWMDKNIKIYIGFWSNSINDWVFYPCGNFIFSSVETKAREISFSCVDWWAKLDGTQFGVLGNFEDGKINAYEYDDADLKIEGTEKSLRDALIEILQLSNITAYDIEEIGEYGGSTKADNYMEYRANNPNWNKLPYDIEFDSSSTVADLIKKVVEIYPNVDAFFDNEGILHVGYLKSNGEENITLINEQIKRIIVNPENGESIPYDLVYAKNMVMCVGESFDIDFYSETVTTASSTYTVTCPEYDDYYTGDIITFIPNSNCVDGMKLSMKNSKTTLSAIPIYNTYTGEPIKKGTILSGTTYSVKISKTVENSSTITRAYLLGAYQPNALCVCTDDINILPYTKNGVEYDNFDSLREYFKTTYNVTNVTFMISQGSPFSIQKLGERCYKYETTGNESIQSDADAIGLAEYVLWQKTRLGETVQVTTKIIPWLSDDDIIEFQPYGHDSVSKYIVKNISHDLGACTSNITLYKYYPLYNEDITEYV